MTAHDCQDTRTRLSDYLDGSLAEAERQALDRALARCADCRAERDKLVATLGQLHGLRETAPPSFLTDIKSQIHRRSRGRFFARRWLLFGRIPFEWVSFLMILAMLLYYIIEMQSAPTGVAPAP